jgi:hypothetical protein
MPGAGKQINRVKSNSFKVSSMNDLGLGQGKVMQAKVSANDVLISNAIFE